MRQLSYLLSFKRQAELNTQAIKRLQATPGSTWWRFSVWALIGLLVSIGGKLLYQRYEAAGFDPFGFALLSCGLSVAILMTFFAMTYRRLLHTVWEGATRDRRFRVMQDEVGLCFTTDEDEYRLRWHGITRMWIERDGVIVSRGPMLLWIADTAFADAGERLTFIRATFARMSRDAQERSAYYLRDVLSEANR
jgi:hypothetical protein